jgi:hypothetical protein
VRSSEGVWRPVRRATGSRRSVRAGEEVFRCVGQPGKKGNRPDPGRIVPSSIYLNILKKDLN